RAGAGGEATRQHPVGLAGERVGGHRIGERKLGAGVERVGVLISGTSRLAEPEISESLLAASKMRHQALEHGTSGLVGIEAEVEEVVQVAATVRLAEADGAVDPPGEHVGRASGVRRLVAQE